MAVYVIVVVCVYASTITCEFSLSAVDYPHALTTHALRYPRGDLASRVNISLVVGDNVEVLRSLQENQHERTVVRH
jgi:hypothetical protein